jgi:hypothetical protein
VLLCVVVLIIIINIMDISDVSVSTGSRKRQKKPTKRELQRRVRYVFHIIVQNSINCNCLFFNEKHELPKFNGIKKCSHKGKQYQCSNVTPAEIEHCPNRIYTTDGNKVLQDQQICHHIIATNPARKRIRKEVVTKKHSISVVYIVNIF